MSLWVLCGLLVFLLAFTLLEDEARVQVCKYGFLPIVCAWAPAVYASPLLLRAFSFLLSSHICSFSTTPEWIHNPSKQEEMKRSTSAGAAGGRSRHHYHHHHAHHYSGDAVGDDGGDDDDMERQGLLMTSRFVVAAVVVVMDWLISLSVAILLLRLTRRVRAQGGERPPPPPRVGPRAGGLGRGVTSPGRAPRRRGRPHGLVTGI